MKIDARIVLMFVCCTLFSCVPLKQFQELQERQDSSVSELKRMKNENHDLAVDNKELQSEVENLKKEVENLKNDTLRLAKQNWVLKNRNKELMKQHKNVLESMSSGSASGSSKELLEHLQSLHEQLQSREDALMKSERELAVKKQKLESSSANLAKMELELEERNKRLYELERILSEKDSLMNALKNTVANALTEFGTDELEVHMKNGKVYVSMEEKLLFGSGSYEVSAIGVNALKKIAQVLEQKSDINVLVEGHTDDVPYRSTVLVDNWDLSVKRATSVVRILLNHSKIEASRITAAGRSEFVPLDPAQTSDARRKNRRTEIILSPNLDQIFDILEDS
ncbi:flagellar motor protein MotB [Labilibacter sediminis]|nr:flagellar motor protein MotB [Labilibacter sediminis]